MSAAAIKQFPDFRFRSLDTSQLIEPEDVNRKSSIPLSDLIQALQATDPTGSITKNIPTIAFKFHSYIEDETYKAVISKQKIAMDNQAALDHLRTRSAEGKIPQKCVYKKKLTLGSDPMQQLATDALNQSLAAISDAASQSAFQALIQARIQLEDTVTKFEPESFVLNKAKESYVNICGGEGKENKLDSVYLVVDERKIEHTLSDSLLSIAFYFGKKRADKKLSDDSAAAAAKQKEKAEALAKKTAADAMMSEADPAKDRETVHKMVQEALEKQKKDFDKAIAKTTKEFEEKLKMVSKNQNRGRESWSRPRNQNKKSTSRSPDSKSSRSRSRSRSHSPMAKTGKTHPARQNHTTRRHLTPRPSRSISPRRGRSRSPSSSTKKIVQSSLKHQSPPPWFAAKEDRDLFSQQQLKTAASSQDAHVSNRGGRGRGRGRGRGQPSPRSSRSPPRNLRDQRGDDYHQGRGGRQPQQYRGNGREVWGRRQSPQHRR